MCPFYIMLYYSSSHFDADRYCDVISVRGSSPKCTHERSHKHTCTAYRHHGPGRQATQDRLATETDDMGVLNFGDIKIGAKGSLRLFVFVPRNLLRLAGGSAIQVPAKLGTFQCWQRSDKMNMYCTKLCALFLLCIAGSYDDASGDPVL